MPRWIYNKVTTEFRTSPVMGSYTTLWNATHQSAQTTRIGNDNWVITWFAFGFDLELPTTTPVDVASQLFRDLSAVDVFRNVFIKKKPAREVDEMQWRAIETWSAIEQSITQSWSASVNRSTFVIWVWQTFSCSVFQTQYSRRDSNLANLASTRKPQRDWISLKIRAI